LTGTLTVNVRRITVTADSGQTKGYGAADPSAYTYALTSGSLKGGDSMSGALSRVAGENVGSYAINRNGLTVSDGNSGGNYAITYVPGVLTVNPTTLRVVALAGSKNYGEADPALLYQVNAVDYRNGDGANIFSGSLSRVAGERIGSYLIHIGSLSAGGNYTINYSNAALAIAASPLTIYRVPPIVDAGLRTLRRINPLISGRRENTMEVCTASPINSCLQASKTLSPGNRRKPRKQSVAAHLLLGTQYVS